MIRRGQVLVRDCGKSRPHWSRGNMISDPRNDFAMVGILEVPDCGYDEHLIRGFIAHSSEGSLSFLASDFQRPLTEHDASDLGHLATQSIWPRPEPVSQFGGGGFLLRHTRMEAEPGYRIVMILAVCSLRPGALLDNHMYDVTGRVGCWPSEPMDYQPGSLELQNPVPVDVPMGNSLSQLLKMPFWGWGEEKVAFVSTMDLATIDQVHRIEDLDAKGGLSPEERNELERLRLSPAGQLLRLSAGDEQYQRFRSRMIAERGLLRWDGVETASEAAARQEIAGRIVRELID